MVLFLGVMVHDCRGWTLSVMGRRPAGDEAKRMCARESQKEALCGVRTKL